MKRLLAILFVLGAVQPAFAEDDPPWAKGVDQTKQDEANKLFAEGNAAFAEQRHAPALEKYRAAIEKWDHPAIHLNLAVTLIRLERVLEASEHLEKALRWNAQPFSEDLYRQALDYRILLGKQIGSIEATCVAREGSILLDGKPWFSCPGTKTLGVVAGEHVIVGESKNYATVSRRVIVAGGKTAKENVDLVRVESLVKLEYPTARWVPWTVAVVGLAIVGSGVGVYTIGRNELKDYEAALATKCPFGCALDPELRGMRDGAERKGTVAAVLFAAGGAVAVTGFVWAIVNRPKRVMPKLEVAPTRGGGMAALATRF